MNIKNCIERAIKGQSKLTDEILAIEGMSSVQNRHLLNNIGAEFESFNYLEIGVHKGSTFISSLYGNKVNRAWAIDNWSEFQNQFSEFEGNCYNFGIEHTLIQDNCFSVDPSLISDVNFYLYDGNHWDRETSMGLTHFYNSLADEFVYVVDDYDWEGVKLGTENGIKKCNLKIKEEIILFSGIGNNAGGWWTGLGIFILKK